MTPQVWRHVFETLHLLNKITIQKKLKYCNLYQRTLWINYDLFQRTLWINCDLYQRTLRINSILICWNRVHHIKAALSWALHPQLSNGIAPTLITVDTSHYVTELADYFRHVGSNGHTQGQGKVNPPRVWHPPLTKTSLSYMADQDPQACGHNYRETTEFFSDQLHPSNKVILGLQALWAVSLPVNSEIMQ